MMVFRAHPDNPGSSPRLQILSLITSAETLFQKENKNNIYRFQGLRPDIFGGNFSAGHAI
jgi:hypothetical protein